MIFGAIDIGTNTLLLLIAEVNENKIIKVLVDEHQIARLGEGLGSTGIISESAIIRATRILHDYKNILKVNKVEKIRVSATSAMRDAKNNNEVKSLFETILGNKIEIISGVDEARISYLGSVEEYSESADIVLDIGGGSTEIVKGLKGNISFSTSLQIGAVRITEQFFPTHKSKLKNLDNARNKIRSSFNELTDINLIGKLIAVAGTPTTIAAIDLNLPQFNAHLIHNHILQVSRLSKIVELFLKYDSEELVARFNVHPNRADVILGGALILEEFANFINSNEILVSCKGLRYGLIIDNYKK